MKAILALLASGIILACSKPASAASQYETFDYYVQQMIAHATANDVTGVRTFQEQLEQLRRPDAGDSVKARPYQQQGLEHLGRTNLKAALAAFRQAFIADPVDPEIAGQLAQTYLRLRRFKEAERLAVYTLSLAPTQSATWSVLGETYGQTGDAPRAAGAFVNAYRFAKNPPQTVERLQQLATADSEPLRAGALQ
ncbi:MAG: tetratricopeptide repeat protein, partial [Candidatus Competibacter sp.]